MKLSSKAYRIKVVMKLKTFKIWNIGLNIQTCQLTNYKVWIESRTLTKLQKSNNNQMNYQSVGYNKK